MLRKEQEITDLNSLNEVLDNSHWGTLGLVSAEGHAVLVPLNFARWEKLLLFHGSKAGQKMDLIRANERGTFLVVEPLSFLPSYALSAEQACHATQYYKSVSITGRVSVIEDLAMKISALNLIMKKFQPEGGYKPIVIDDKNNNFRLNSTAVIQLNIETIIGKFAYGQKLRPEQRKIVQQFLHKRGTPLDKITIEMIGNKPE